MLENICLVARFESLEHAGKAYDPIQALLRVEQFTNVSVFRIELHGVAHVAVVGEQPEAHIMEVINQALGLGELITPDADIVGWLLERRVQRPEQVGFSEGHYTRETGPRPSREPRRQRRQVPTLAVTWQDDLPTAEDAGGAVHDLLTGDEVDGDALLNNITEIMGYASKDSWRPVLADVSLTLGETLEVACSDGSRLTRKTLPIQLVANEVQAPQAIVLAGSFAVLARLWNQVGKRLRTSTAFEVERLTASPQLHVAALAAGRRYTEITFGRLWACFQIGEATLITQTIDGDFPDYHSIIPKTFKHSAVFDVVEGYRVDLSH